MMVHEYDMFARAALRELLSSRKIRWCLLALVEVCNEKDKYKLVNMVEVSKKQWPFISLVNRIRLQHT